MGKMDRLPTGLSVYIFDDVHIALFLYVFGPNEHEHMKNVAELQSNHEQRSIINAENEYDNITRWSYEYVKCVNANLTDFH